MIPSVQSVLFYNCTALLSLIFIQDLLHITIYIYLYS